MSYNNHRMSSKAVSIQSCQIHNWLLCIYNNSQAEARCRRKDTGMDVMFERESITSGSIANLYCPDGFGVLDCLTISSFSLR